MVRDNITGYTVPPEDIDALSEKNHRRLTSQRKNQEMGLEAQKLISTEYIVRITLQELLPEFMEKYRSYKKS